MSEVGKEVGTISYNQVLEPDEDDRARLILCSCLLEHTHTSCFVPRQRVTPFMPLTYVNTPSRLSSHVTSLCFERDWAEFKHCICGQNMTYHSPQISPAGVSIASQPEIW